MLRNNIIQVCQFHRNSIKCLYSCSSTRTQRLKPFCDYLVLYIAGHLCARRRWGLFVFLHIFVYFVARGEADVCLSQHFYIFVYIHLLLYICIYCAGRRQCLFVPNFLASPQDSTWLPICCNPVSSHYFLFFWLSFIEVCWFEFLLFLITFTVSRKMTLHCIQKHLVKEVDHHCGEIWEVDACKVFCVNMCKRLNPPQSGALNSSHATPAGSLRLPLT